MAVISNDSLLEALDDYETLEAMDNSSIVKLWVKDIVWNITSSWFKQVWYTNVFGLRRRYDYSRRDEKQKIEEEQTKIQCIKSLENFLNSSEIETAKHELEVYIYSIMDNSITNYINDLMFLVHDSGESI